MTDQEYQKCLKFSKNFLYTSPGNFTQITADDLVTETLLYLYDNGIEFSVKNFKDTITKARSKMVKELLNQNIVERHKQQKRVKTWQQENSVRYNAIRRKRANPTGRKTSDRTYETQAKGKNHRKFKGTYITPTGKFESSYQAAIANNTSHSQIQRWCKSEKHPEYYILLPR